MKEMRRLFLIISSFIIGIKSQTIGIHFGADSFSIGMIRNDNPVPQIKAQDISSILFNDDYVLFGYDSLKQKDTSPQDILDLLYQYPGKTLQDPQVKQFIEENFIAYDLESNQNTSTISFRVRYIKQTEVFSIEEIYSMLFNYIKETAESYYKQTISSAIVTIPTFYTYKETEALRQGIELSSLNLNGFVTENMAIAVDYQFNNTFSSSGTMTLFLNIGPWYAQSSIYDLSTTSDGVNEIKTISEGWNRSIGERVFDRKIAMMLYEKYNRKDIKLNKELYTKFFHQVWKCKELLEDKEKEEIAISIKEIEDKSVVIRISKNDIDHLVNSLIEDITKLVNKTLFNSKLNPADIKIINYYGDIFKYPVLREVIDNKIKSILSNDITINRRKSKSIVKGVSLLSQPGKMIKFTNGANSQLNLHFSNRHLYNTSKLCKDELNDLTVTLYNSSCIHALNRNITFIHLRQGYEMRRSISFYHDSDFEVDITEVMEGSDEKEGGSIVKTYRITDISMLLEEMESNRVKTIPKIVLLFYYNRVGQLSLKAEGNYNVTLYMGKSIGPGGNEEIIYSQDYTPRLSEEEIKEIDRKISSATSEDEK